MSQNSFSALSLSEYASFIRHLYEEVNPQTNVDKDAVGLFSPIYELIYGAISVDADGDRVLVVENGELKTRSGTVLMRYDGIDVTVESSWDRMTGRGGTGY